MKVLYKTKYYIQQRFVIYLNNNYFLAFYKYWLENEYSPVTKDDAKNLAVDMIRYSYYAGRKIADMKKPPSTKNLRKPKKTTTKSKQNLERETIGSDSIDTDDESDGREKDKNDNDDDLINGKHDSLDDYDNMFNDYVKKMDNVEEEQEDGGSTTHEEIESKIADNQETVDPLLFVNLNDIPTTENFFDYSPTLSPESSVTVGETDGMPVDE